MDYETIGRLAVEWREAEDAKAFTRAEFMLAYVAACEEHGQPCRGSCEQRSGCAVEHDGECSRQQAVHAATRVHYANWRHAANRARSARAVMTKKIRREQQRQAEAEAAAQRLADEQGELFEKGETCQSQFA